MKKAYVILIGVLIVIIIAFVYAKSYLSRLESNEIRIKTELSRRQLIDSLQQTFEMMATNRTGDLQRKYDSLVRESNTLIYALESQLDLYLNPEFDPVAQEDKQDSTISGDTLTDSTNAVNDQWKSEFSPQEYEIYIAYLERVNALPKDLTSYEKKVAYGEAEKDLAKEYSVAREDIRKILKKLRKHSIKGRSNN